jgi:hypothetical protein
VGREDNYKRILRILILSLVLLFLFYFSGCGVKESELRKRRPLLPSQPKPGAGKSSKRQFPQTLDRIYVFNDQLSSEMTEEQYKFSTDFISFVA